MAFIDELMKLQGKQMGRTPPAAEPTAPQAPQATQGPLMANDPRAVPMLGGFEVRGEGAERFPLGVPEDKLIPQPFDPLSFFEGRTEGTPAPTGGVQPESPFISNPALEGMTPDFARQMNVPSEILTRPEAPTATSTTGQVSIQPPVSDFTRGEVSPIIGQAPSERGQPFAAPTTMAGGERPFDPNAALASPLAAPSAPIQPAPTQGLTTVGNQPLSEFLAGGTQLGGRGLTGEAGRAALEQAGIQAGTRAGPDGTFADPRRGEARGPDSRDNQTGISDADRRDIAKANQPGASAGDMARGQKVADRAGVDLKTGQPLASEGGLTFDQVMKMKDFDFKRDQEAYKREQDSMTAAGKASEAFDKDEALLRQVSGDAGRIGRLTNEAIGVTTEMGTTGLSGSILKHVPGTDAHKLDSILEVVSSKVALDRLMEVKKTGATLGQVSEKELAMLQNSYDTLKQGLKGERLREALVNYATQLKAVEDKTAKAFIEKHGQEKFDKIMGGGGSSGGEPRYANDQNVGDSAESYYNPSK